MDSVTNGSMGGKSELAPEVSAAAAVEQLESQIAEHEEGDTFPAEVDAGAFMLRDDEGEVRARLGMLKYRLGSPQPALALYDHKGKQRVLVGIHHDGLPFVELFDRDENTLVALSERRDLKEGGAAALRFEVRTGEHEYSPMLELGVKEAGLLDDSMAPFIELRDRDRNTIKEIGGKVDTETADDFYHRVAIVRPLRHVTDHCLEHDENWRPETWDEVPESGTVVELMAGVWDTFGAAEDVVFGHNNSQLQASDGPITRWAVIVPPNAEVGVGKSVRARTATFSA